jgi:phytoene dehydrogenase-like protein
MTDAVVIGAGPNGLVAANLLADAGWDVVVLEANDEPGGAVRSGELLEPGFVQDLCSAFYPLAAASPAFRRLELERHGLEWCRGPLVLAHPSSDGTCVSLSRDLDETAASLDSFAPGDGDAWRSLFALWERTGPLLLDAMVRPLPPLVPAARLLLGLGPAGLADFSRLALLPVRRLAEERFGGAGAARLLAGNALHADVAPESSLGGFFGWLLCSLGQDVGYPFPRGGAGRLTEALVRRLESRGGRVVTRARVERVLVRRGAAVGVRAADGTEVGARRAVLADVDAPSLYLELVGEEHLPARVVAAIRRFDWDLGTVKLDWTLDGPVPWSAEDARRAPVVHVVDGVDELTVWAGELARGLVPERPFLVFGQYAVGDPTRAPEGKDTAWAYTHVPRRMEWDGAALERFADRIEAQVERLAPGFRGLVRRRSALGPGDLERLDSNLSGGALNGGTAQLHQQLVFRPVPGLGRPETPVRRLYLASASAHPGGGVHGAPGAIAARAALSARRGRTVALGAAAAAGGALTLRRARRPEARR